MASGGLPSPLALLSALILTRLMTGVSAVLVARETVNSHEWPESQCRCQASWAERHVDHADPVKILPEGLQHIEIDEFVRLREQFIERLYGYGFSELPGRVEQELEIASNDPGHPLRVLEDLGSAEYGAFSQTAHLMAQAWGLRQNLAVQRGSFLSWMRVPGDVLMPCICPTGAVVAVSIKFPNEQFVEEMKDPNSDETLAFGSNLREKVTTELALVEPAIVDLHVISLESGSVVVNADILLSTSMDKATALSKVETALNAVADQTNPPSMAEMEIDSSGFVYEVLECEESAPAPPANGQVSVPTGQRTSGTRALYTCQPGFEFSDGETTEVELTCGHVTRTWGDVPLLCERPPTTAAPDPRSTTRAPTTTTGAPTTTEEPDTDYMVYVTMPATAGMMIFFFLLIWCVSTKGPICSLITDKKKASQIP